jgi:hypothetical protein
MKIQVLLIALFIGFQSLVSAETQSNLTIYAYPPYRKLDWSSPRSLLMAFAKTALDRTTTNKADVNFTSDFGEEGKISSHYVSTMGHTLSHVSCVTSSGQRYDKWSSYSGQDFPEVDQRLTLKEKRGMGAMFYDFVDGHIISGSENVKRLVHYKNQDESIKPVYIQFEISRKQCDDLKKMITFFESFRYPKGTSLQTLEARPPEQILFFNTMDPYETYKNRLSTGTGLVGGGCAPYGVALVKMIGEYDKELFDRSWGFNRPISEKLIGGTVDSASQQVRQISIGDILFGSTGRNWIYSGTPNRDLYLYDPQMIWEFVHSVKRCLVNTSSASCSANAGAWLNRVGHRISVGEDQQFSDVIPESDQANVQTGRQVEVKVSIDGIRLRKELK